MMMKIIMMKIMMKIIMMMINLPVRGRRVVSIQRASFGLETQPRNWEPRPADDDFDYYHDGNQDKDDHDNDDDDGHDADDDDDDYGTDTWVIWTKEALSAATQTPTVSTSPPTLQFILRKSRRNPKKDEKETFWNWPQRRQSLRDIAGIW